jgi:MFS family permease
MDNNNNANRKPLFIAWYLAVLFGVFFILSFVDRQIIAVLVPYIKEELALTDLQLSYIGGLSFVIFYTTLGIPIGRMVDIYNRKYILLAGILIWTSATSLCSLASQYWHLLVLRMGVGIGEATLAPCSFSILADVFPRERLATAIGICTTGAAIGLGLAYLGGALVLDWTNTHLINEGGTVSIPLLGDLTPWRFVFLVVGVPGILLAMLLFTFKEPQRKAPVGQAAIGGGNPENAIPTIREVIGYAQVHWQAFLFIYLATGFVSLSVYAGGFWDIVMMDRVYGWPPAQAGIYYGILTIVGQMMGNLGGGYFADYLSIKRGKDSKIVVVTLGAFACMWFSLFYPLMPNEKLSLALIIPAVLLKSVPYGVIGAAIQIMSPARMRGQLTALYYLVISLIGMAIGPTAVAFLTERVFESLYMVGFSIAIIGAASQLLAFVFYFLALKPYQRAIAAVTQ